MSINDGNGSNDVKASAATLKKYFDFLPGQTLTDFKNEYDQLDDSDKVVLTRNIKNGLLTY